MSTAAFASEIFIALWHRNKLVNENCNKSSKYILCLQCVLRDFEVEKVQLVALWIHEIPLYNLFFVFGTL